MKHLVVILVSIGLLFSCNKAVENNEVSSISSEAQLSGHYDNFLQYWLENTITDMHRVETAEKHRHLSVIIEDSDAGGITMEIREGRNGKTLLETIALTQEDINTHLNVKGDTIYISKLKHFKNTIPYKLIKTRRFSGWIELPLGQFKDSTYRKSNLEIHDHGGMAEIDIEGKQYTAELTQLVFGKKIPLMKLAIYEMPMDSVGINSRSISYTWATPESKRLGINLRKVVSGWTFIEPGYMNSDNTKFKK